MSCAVSGLCRTFISGRYGSLIVMDHNWNLHSHTPRVVTMWFSELVHDIVLLITMTISTNYSNTYKHANYEEGIDNS